MNYSPLFRTFDVSQAAPYEITLVLLYVRLSVRPSLSFLKIGSLAFSDRGVSLFY